MSATADGKNLNPIVDEQPSKKLETLEKERLLKEMDLLRDGGEEDEEIDSYEIFDMLRHINDPEHPLTLEKLRVIKPELIKITKSMTMWLSSLRQLFLIAQWLHWLG